MAKPPKKVPGSHLSDTSSTTTRPTSENSPIAGDHVNMGRPDSHPQGTETTPDAHSSDVQHGEVTRQPSIVVSDIPGTETITPASALRSVSWPADQVGLLTPIVDKPGLFNGPDGKTYAHIADEGHFLVELKPDGRYQVPFAFTPDLSGPFLTKVEGQPHWRFELPDWVLQGSGATTQMPVIVAPPRLQPPTLLPAHLAAMLTKAENSVDGIRYDRRGGSYVDMEDGTTFKVRKRPDGSYQQSSAHEFNSLGELVEQMPGTKLWRRKGQDTTKDIRRPATESEEPTAGPSKRPRLEEDGDTSDPVPWADIFFSNTPAPVNPSIGQWKNWGKVTKPRSGESIEIDGQHYPIVPQGVEANTRLVSLEHPRFSPGRFDAFEQMLQDSPELQPKGAVKVDDKWMVIESRLPFEKTMTQYVADTFRHLSDHSANAVARAMFRWANHSEVINAHGLYALFDVFQHWANRGTINVTRQELAEPLLMLAAAPKSGRTLAIPRKNSEQFLERLDFAPPKGSKELLEYNGSLLAERNLFIAVLEGNGYIVNRKFVVGMSVMFRRKDIDADFVLGISHGAGEKSDLPRYHSKPTNTRQKQREMLTSPGQDDPQRLLKHFDEGKIIFLLGGVTKSQSGSITLFVLREK